MSELQLIDDLVKLARSYKDPKTLLGPGDDAAVIDLSFGPECITTDQYVENQHFRHRWIRPSDLAARCLSATVSDLAAMGATPRWLTLAITLTSDQDRDWLMSFGQRLGQILALWNIDLIGGDLTRGERCSICMTMGGTAQKGRLLLRRGAQPDDGIWVSGNLGGSAAALEYLERGGKNHNLVVDFFSAKHRVLLGLALNRSGVASSCCDISDGLLTDLTSLLNEDCPGALLDLKRLPVSPIATRVSQELACSTRPWVLNGGEDFELLFTVPPRREEAMGDLSEALGIPLTRIGTMAETPGIINVEGRALSPAGWDPFRDS